MQAVQTGISGLLEKLGPTAVGIGAIGTAAIAAAVKIFKLAAAGADAAEQIQNVSYSTGISVEKIQALQRLGEEKGLGDLATKIQRLNAQLGDPAGGDFTEALLRMGIAMRPDKDALDYIAELRARYAALKDPIKAAQQAVHDFGVRGFQVLGPLVLDASLDIKKAMEDIEKSGAIMSKSEVDHFLELDRKIDEHGRKWKWLGKEIKLASLEIVDAFISSITPKEKANDIPTSTMLGMKLLNLVGLFPKIPSTTTLPPEVVGSGTAHGDYRQSGCRSLRDEKRAHRINNKA
jgi:hypothetical protein